MKQENKDWLRAFFVGVITVLIIDYADKNGFTWLLLVCLFIFGLPGQLIWMILTQKKKKGHDDEDEY